MSAQKTIALVSGANTGIGLEVATQLARDHAYHVIIGSRNASTGEKVAATFVERGYSASSVQLDLSSDVSISAAVSSIEQDHGALDVLVNNAGILLDLQAVASEKQPGLSTRDLFTQTFNTNLIGTACLTEACLPLLRKARVVPRIVFVSSRMGSLAVSTDKSTPFYATDYKAYDASKAAVNMLAVNYARILEEQGAMVNAACPGLVKTRMTSDSPYGAPVEVGAKRIVELAVLEKGGPTARFSDRNGDVPW